MRQHAAARRPAVASASRPPLQRQPPRSLLGPLACRRLPVALAQARRPHPAVAAAPAPAAASRQGERRMRAAAPIAAATAAAPAAHAGGRLAESCLLARRAAAAPCRPLFIFQPKTKLCEIPRRPAPRSASQAASFLYFYPSHRLQFASLCSPHRSRHTHASGAPCGPPFSPAPFFSAHYLLLPSQATAPWTRRCRLSCAGPHWLPLARNE